MIIGAAIHLLGGPDLDEIDDNIVKDLSRRVRGGEIKPQEATRFLVENNGDYIVDWIQFNYLIDQVTNADLGKSNLDFINSGQQAINNGVIIK